MHRKTLKKLIFIHGGDSYKSSKEYKNAIENLKAKEFDPSENNKSWKEKFFKKMFKNGWIMYYPKMPCKDNAKYKEWKLVFEKYLKKLNRKSVLIGHSLGASFLLKYFSENPGHKFKELHLIAPALNVGNFTHNIKKFKNISEQFEKIFIYHSKDDIVVPFEDSEKISRALPSAKFIIFEDRNHFFDERSPEVEKMMDK